ncbi:MAG: phosphate ABC transporter substrate-binding protein, partial [Anaerolineae bacterium]|nr:phosphate ABC transporter substrate-binding protein [Anaerolineae bacterium]
MTTRRKKLSFVLPGLLIVTLLAAVVGCQQATPTAEPAEEPAEAPAEEPTAAPAEEEEASGQLQLAGSSTVQPLAQALAEAFMAQNPDVAIDVQGGGSSVGVKSAAEGTTPIGNASRALKDSEMEEYPDLIAHTIARDGIAIAVHPDVPVDGVSTDEVRQVFAGEITNWSELGGPDENIVVVSREEGSGT